jgi:RNA polymerase sigma-70 factor (ECF subfamily)
MISDEQLAQGIQQGSEADLRWLVERHHGPLLGFLWRMTNGDRPFSQQINQQFLLPS